MRLNSAVVCLFGLLTVATSGCGSSSSAVGRVQAAMANLTPTARSTDFPEALLRGIPSLLTINGTAAAATEFQIRLAAIYLVEDQTDATANTGWVGNNTGNAIMIWSATDCEGFKQGDESGCTNMAYFDLNRSSSAVNTSLNSQKVDAAVGTYRYVKLAMLGSTKGGNNTYLNTKWAQQGSSTATQEFASIKTEWGAKFDTPIQLAEGETITVTLNYDLSNVVYTGSTASEKVAGAGNYQPGAADDCAGAGSPRTCLVFPDLTVTAAKQ